jgi:adenine nucleotide transporter 17
MVAPSYCTGIVEVNSMSYVFIVSFSCWQGVYYYFYQVFKNKAEAIATARKAKGRGDGTIGMFSWLTVAALAG